MQKKCKKICVSQKKAVPLHPLFEKQRSASSRSGHKPAERLWTEEREHGENSYERFLSRIVLSRCSREGAIAQLVEQRTENPCVPSSILGGTTERDFRVSFLFFYRRAS